MQCEFVCIPVVIVIVVQRSKQPLFCSSSSSSIPFQTNVPILFVKVAHIGHQILNDIHVGKWINLGRHLGIVVNVREACQRVVAIDIHGARSTNAFPAGPAKGQCRILFVFDFEECVQDHRTAVGQIDGIRRQVGPLIGLFGIPTVHLKVFDALLGGRSLRSGSGYFLFQLGFGGRRQGGCGQCWKLRRNGSLCMYDLEWSRKER